ncbi:MULTISPECIES: MarR family winged helix-turn-helix transcriptional regulator [Rhodococcus]|uniref:MarR family winged helix-turn-helix transcriptional regulator n=1 Tax=Rhodococcus rhodochrous TaxID=1829 RepID=A0AAW4XL04_RHORH|nr:MULTISPECIES: MarR family winged helix-turn-helix transcriptional regulator [Rhodococcus]MCD2113825.1 MarR family winged helix-turn-helix transcriptional regulator [Rhodococcus rhodochrous]QHG84306.1 MarR family transcriptional regulator [Rhodococcus rhodochrous]QOH55956.1 MarR family transcriptional regulator [Rhodococcus rhodochrous]WAL48011.1 MarR family winged helix-turn-helix transcriptional regulator [Rhodococcus pyridinivorans]
MQHNRQARRPSADGVARVYEEFVLLVRFLTSGARAQDNGLSLVQHSLLGFISRNPGCRATDISEVFGVHRSTVSRQLRHAVDAGWVEAGTGPARAGHPLRLTDHGATVLEGAVVRRLDDVRAGLEGWDEDELERFVDLLRRFRAGIDSDDRTPDQNDGDCSA